jgi:hypothetical protein
MGKMHKANSSDPSYAELNGIPQIDVQANLRAAVAAGRMAPGLLAETARLRFGVGRLTPAEYFYYRLWEDRLPFVEKQAFVGKLAQGPMHVAAGSMEWHATSADKILFHSIMAGAGFRVPELLAITQAGRHATNVPTLADLEILIGVLSQPSIYPLFAKQVAGKYSLSVVSADSFDPRSDEVLLLDGTRQKVGEFAALLIGGAGYLIQRRMQPIGELAASFGPRLWSVRLLVFMTQDGPVIHRAAAKIATGANPADNYWRQGNRLGAIELDTGRISRVVTGTGLDLREDENHPDTGQPIAGTVIPEWERILEQVKLAAQVFAGIRTQSWDIALADPEPTFLELNFGGDLNLHQISHGRGVLDEQYRSHLRRCGYKGKI